MSWRGVVASILAKRRLRRSFFVPSAVSEPLWTLHLCGQRMQRTGLLRTSARGCCVVRKWCCSCCNERRVQQGEQPVKAAQWRGKMEQKTSRGKLWVAFGMEQFTRGMWQHFTVKRAWSKAVLADAEKEKQEGTQVSGCSNRFFKEVLEQILKSSDMSCMPT